MYVHMYNSKYMYLYMLHTHYCRVSFLVSLVTIVVPMFLQILKSPEGENLRARQQAAVSQMYAALVDAGIPAVQTPSHIIPVHVSGQQ